MIKSDWIAGLRATLGYSVGLAVGLVVLSSLSMLNLEDQNIPSYLLCLLIVFVLAIVGRKF